MNVLGLFETALAEAADTALQSPTGGFLAYLQKTPQVAAFYAIAVTVAHGYLSGLESKLAPPATAAPTTIAPAIPSLAPPATAAPNAAVRS